MAKAPIGKRIIAYFIDGILVTLLVLVLSIGPMILGMLAGMISDTLGALITMLSLPLMVVSIILYGVYWLLKDGLNNGRSYGKKFMGLKVVTEGGGACGKKDSLLRNITWMIPLVGVIELILPLVDGEGKRIGDKIANTQVVEA